MKKLARFAASVITIGVSWWLRRKGVPTTQALLAGGACLAVYLLAVIENS